MKVPKKFVFSLSEDQTQSLESLMKSSPFWRVRMRAHFILLSSREFSIDEIADIYNVHRNSVSPWIDAWNESGIDGLEDLPRSGRPPDLTESEKEIALQLIKEEPRSLKTVSHNLTEQTGKTVSITTLKRIAKSAKLTWKRTRKSLRSKKDEKEFEKAQSEIDELKKQQQAGELDLYYFDESGFSLNPVVPYAWQPAGETIEIPAARSKRLNVLGFLNAYENKIEPFSFECNIDTSVVVACFNKFSETLKKRLLSYSIMLQHIPVQSFRKTFQYGRKKDYFLNTYLPIVLNSI